MNWPLSARVFILAAAILAPLPTLAGAQDTDPNRKIGIIGFGIGGGAVTNGTAYENVSVGSLALRVSGGGKNLRLGINIDVAAGLAAHDVALNGPGGTGTITCGDGCAHVITSILVGAEFHPAERGLYVTSGAGFAFEKFIFTGDNNTSVSLDGARGLAFMVGAGFDMRLGARNTLTPYVHYVIAPKFETEEATRGGASMNRLVFGLSLGFPGSGSK